MMQDIARKCTELLMQINSPVYQNFEVNFNKDSQTIYQRFAFVSALINTNEFNEAVQKIISSPTTKWKEEKEQKDVRSLRRIDNFSIKQIISGSNRINLIPPISNLNSIPLKIESVHKFETLNTHENKFIKHALEVFLQFCIDCKEAFINFKYEKSKLEAIALIENLENHLNNPFFKEIERPTTLKLNSPALQRKSGYREILNAWLQFDLAAKLIWKGGDDVYKAGKRDIAVLYEYWLFFVLYDLIKDKFNLDIHSSENDPYLHLIDETKDGLNVMVKSGKFTALEGIYNSGLRALRIKFSYNRTFEGDTKYNAKKAGSWTKVLRPDYTLSIWPNELKDENEAEKNEKIVHIHFDSKYKVQQFKVQTKVTDEVDEDDTNENEQGNKPKIDSLEKEKKEERKGIYKNIDLLKMHAYKDAIRRTSGAYVLYPGTEEHQSFTGFHELVPGLGAFAITPMEGLNGSEELSDFIDKIISHFNNMATQQRRLATKVYEIHEYDNKNVLNEQIPEHLIPDETFVLVGYYKDNLHLKWIIDKALYNVRYGDKYNLTVNEIGAKYLLLYTKGDKKSNLFYKIELSKGPKFYTKTELKKNLKYPTNPSEKLYLVYTLSENLDEEFINKSWDLTKLKNLRLQKKPFSVSLTQLLNIN